MLIIADKGGCGCVCVCVCLCVCVCVYVCVCQSAPALVLMDGNREERFWTQEMENGKFLLLFILFKLETDALEANTTNKIEFHFTAADIWMFPILVLKKIILADFCFYKSPYFSFFM